MAETDIRTIRPKIVGAGDAGNRYQRICDYVIRNPLIGDIQIFNMKKSDSTKCPKCKGRGWEDTGRMTLYYSSGRMRTVPNASSKDPETMEELSVFRKITKNGIRYSTPEQAKIDSTDYLKRKVMEPCSFCKGKKLVNKEQLLLMKLRGEI